MEQTKTITYHTLVNKAGLPLAQNESVNAFTQKLREAAQKHIAQKLNLSAQKCSAYMIDVYSTSAIFDVYKSSMTSDTPGTYAYYAVTYKRNAKGAFEFSETMEVERVISFQAKDSIGVSKSSTEDHADFEASEDAVQKARVEKARRRMVLHQAQWALPQSIFAGLV